MTKIELRPPPALDSDRLPVHTAVRRDQAYLTGLLLALCGGIALVHLLLVFPAAVLWDESRFLSDVYSFQRGHLTSSLQTFHVYLFGWLPAVGAHEVDQVIAGRLVYYSLLLGSCALLYLISRRFLSAAGAAFTILCFLGFREVLATATSFRFDGLAIFFVLGAIALLLHSHGRRHRIVAAGALTALSLMVTVKTIFYLPTLMAIGILGQRHHTVGDRARDAVLLLGSVLIVFLGLWIPHHVTLSLNAGEASAGWITAAGQRVLSMDVLFPARWQLAWSLSLNPVTWGVLLLGSWSLVRRFKTGDDRREVLLLSSLLIPLASLALYRNAFAYFYVFIMPSALVVAGAWFDGLLTRIQRDGARAAGIGLVMVVTGVLLSSGVNTQLILRQTTVVEGQLLKAQRQVVGAVHRIFPEPVPYIDGGSMIASFPKVGFFMSSWGFQNYREAGTPIFRALLEQEHPRFLLATQEALLPDTVVGGDWKNPDRFFAQDEQVLRDNFVHHWGPIYVAGKQLTVSSAAPAELEIVIPGTYTVEARWPIVINGDTREPGGYVDLPAGRFQILSVGPEQNVVLRWGKDLYRPEDPPLPMPIMRRARPVMPAAAP